jgi:hypothetical protein
LAHLSVSKQWHCCAVGFNTKIKIAYSKSSRSDLPKLLFNDSTCSCKTFRPFHLLQYTQGSRSNDSKVTISFFGDELTPAVSSKLQAPSIKMYAIVKLYLEKQRYWSPFKMGLRNGRSNVNNCATSIPKQEVARFMFTTFWKSYVALYSFITVPMNSLSYITLWIPITSLFPTIRTAPRGSVVELLVLTNWDSAGRKGNFNQRIEFWERGMSGIRYVIWIDDNLPRTGFVWPTLKNCLDSGPPRAELSNGKHLPQLGGCCLIFPDFNHSENFVSLWFFCLFQKIWWFRC